MRVAACLLAALPPARSRAVPAVLPGPPLALAQSGAVGALRGASLDAAGAWRLHDAFQRPVAARVRLTPAARAPRRRPATAQQALLQTEDAPDDHGIVGGALGGQLVGSVFAGLPPQEFSVAFDTGSGNMILPSSLCGSVACQAHRQYHAQYSGSSLPVARADDLNATVAAGEPRETVRLAFGQGAVVGQLASDRVCLGPDENLCAQTGFVEALEMSSTPFLISPYDGVLGLGLSGLSLRPHFNLMDNLGGAGGRFAVWLARDGDGEASEITFGAADGSRVGSRQVIWQRLARPHVGVWDVAMRDATLGGELLGACGPGGCFAAFDTGTAVIGGPAGFIAAIRARLGDTGDCEGMDRLPALGFVIGDKVLRLEPSDYMAREGDRCLPRLMVIDVPPPKGPLVLLGTPFLSRYYTIYDRQALMMGVAVARHRSDVPNSAAVSARLITDVSDLRAK